MTFQLDRPQATQPLVAALKALAVAMTLGLAVGIVIFALAPPSPDTTPGINDKVLHFGAFLSLILPCAVILARHLIWVAPVTLIFGGAIEILQPGFGREASWADFQADALGVAAGVALGLAIRAAIKRRVEGPKRRDPL